MVHVGELWYFGGVDSRSNPLNMPLGRALRCKNWVPKESGVLELRRGYATVSMSTVSAGTIHSLAAFRSGDNRALVLVQGQQIKKLELGATGTVTTCTFHGDGLSTSGRGSFYLANQRLHLGNGADQKWFDGVVWRDSGIRALTDGEVASVTIVEGVRQMTAAELTSATVAVGAGSAFAVSTKGGHLFYVALFDPTVNELGPATSPLDDSRLKVTSGANGFFSLSSLPNLSAVDANWVKLVARTEDGGSRAYFVTNASGSGATLSRANATATTATITLNSHGLSLNDVVIMSGWDTTDYDGVWNVNGTPSANTFTIGLDASLAPNYATSASGGTVNRILKVSNTGTTATINSIACDTSYVVNQQKGVAATSVGGAQPGYQFYAAVYNPTTGHVGNRLAIAGRMANTNRCNFRITNLPNLSSADSEWELLIGRTGDGGEVPYAITDGAGNWKSAGNTDGKLTIVDAAIDGAGELPVRNGVVPPELNLFARVGDRIYGASSGSPTIYRSATEADARSGDFVGRPEQSWAPNDIETFPTAQPLTCLAEWEYELFCFTENDSAVLSDLAGMLAWRGPWNVGCAGARAFCRTPYGFYWLTGDLQLATLRNGVPTSVSDDYEAALLSQIGREYMGNVELVYQREAAKGIDRILVSAVQADGTPVQIYHDLKLRDERSAEGQAYEGSFAGSLSSAFQVLAARDEDSKAVTFAAAANGQLYKLNEGEDDGGSEFSGDYITLVNAGQDRKDIPWVDWHGDQNLVVSIAQRLDATEDSFEVLAPAGAAEAVFGQESDFRFRVKLDAPSINHAYIRLQLDSHSQGGSMELSEPPHLPIESYGRVYGVLPALGSRRGR